jgi:TM2 domain-containing membrane protein YozV
MMKNKKLAGLLSVIWPGLGHLYMGRYTDGIVFMAGTGVLWAIILIKASYLWEMGVREMIFWTGFGVVYVYALVDVLKKVKQK